MPHEKFFSKSKILSKPRPAEERHADFLNHTTKAVRYLTRAVGNVVLAGAHDREDALVEGIGELCRELEAELETAKRMSATEFVAWVEEGAKVEG